MCRVNESDRRAALKEDGKTNGSDERRACVGNRFAASNGFECRGSIQTNRRHAEREPTGQEADDPDKDEGQAEPPEILTHSDRACEPYRRADDDGQCPLAR